MKYTELRKNLLNLKEALEKENKLMKNDEAKIQETLQQCQNEMNKAETIKLDQERIARELRELVIKVNSLKQKEDYIFSANNIGLEEKIEKFAYAVGKTAEEAQNLKKLKDELSMLEEKMISEEVTKKIQNLTSIWIEIKKIAEIDDVVDQIEMEFIESTNNVTDSEDTVEERKDVEELINVLKELDTEIKEEQQEKDKNKKRFKFF